MRALAKKFATETTEMFVSAYSSRPVMHVRPKDTNLRSTAYTFSDAIARFGSEIAASELGDAYKRAGAAFKGQLQQNFVVLHGKKKGLLEKTRWAPADNLAMGGGTTDHRKSVREGGSKKLEDQIKRQKQQKNNYA